MRRPVTPRGLHEPPETRPEHTAPHHCADPAPETVPAAKQPPLHEPVPRNATHAPSGVPGTGAQSGREKEQRGQRPRESNSHSLTRASASPAPLPVFSPRSSRPCAPLPRRAPTFSCASQPRPFLPSQSPVSIPVSLTRPGARTRPHPATHRLPARSPREPLTATITSRRPKPGPPLTVPALHPPSLRLSEEAPHRAPPRAYCR